MREISLGHYTQLQREEDHAVPYNSPEYQVPRKIRRQGCKQQLIQILEVERRNQWLLCPFAAPGDGEEVEGRLPDLNYTPENHSPFTRTACIDLQYKGITDLMERTAINPLCIDCILPVHKH
ncbi:hypothetical protein Y1Q_0007832 [Alligator mississippiensis]|uniref:Uncharacterized protein n=1 Tax=Alligator mississippiensis TaxID=8496 RepID=A0A151N7T9_ALLMI|nr:hypothetical protein Y1Q_0007832 [Alligator mississippiensis]